MNDSHLKISLDMALEDAYLGLSHYERGSEEYKRTVESISMLETIKRDNEKSEFDQTKSKFEKVTEKVVEIGKIAAPILAIVLAEVFANARQRTILEYEKDDILRSDAAKAIKKENFDTVKSVVSKIKI